MMNFEPSFGADLEAAQAKAGPFRGSGDLRKLRSGGQGGTVVAMVAMGYGQHHQLWGPLGQIH